MENGKVLLILGEIQAVEPIRGPVWEEWSSGLLLGGPPETFNEPGCQALGPPDERGVDT